LSVIVNCSKRHKNHHVPGKRNISGDNMYKMYKNNEISLEILQIKKHTCFLCMWLKRDDITKLFVIAICKKTAPSNEESTTTTTVVQKSTTAPQTNLRSSNNFDIACDITCDIIRSSITTTDSTNKRKLTYKCDITGDITCDITYDITFDITCDTTEKPGNTEKQIGEKCNLKYNTLGLLIFCN
jgi:hypothetical protein